MLVVEGMNDDAGAEEQEGLEKGMGHEVEHGGRPCAHPEGEEHVSDLADRGVSEDPFDVLLRQRAESREEERHGADDRHGGLDKGSKGKENMGPCDEIDPGGHHGRRMDEGAHRRGARHGVRQPRLERELGRFAHGAAEEQGSSGDGQGRADGPLRCSPLHQLLDVEGVQVRKEEKDADGHCRVADACYDEGLARGTAVGRVRIPETDKKIAAEAHALPAEVEKQQVVGQDEDQHGADEEIHVGKEAAVALLVDHELR